MRSFYEARNPIRDGATDEKRIGGRGRGRRGAVVDDRAPLHLSEDRPRWNSISRSGSKIFVKRAVPFVHRLFLDRSSIHPEGTSILAFFSSSPFDRLPFLPRLPPPLNDTSSLILVEPLPSPSSPPLFVSFHEAEAEARCSRFFPVSVSPRYPNPRLVALYTSSSSSSSFFFLPPCTQLDRFRSLSLSVCRRPPSP